MDEIEYTTDSVIYSAEHDALEGKILLSTVE